MGNSRKTKLAYAGNSLVVRIPKDIVKFLKLDKGKEVFVTIGGKKKLIVEAC
ncbi:MAG: AbrB/MazE/SpoVT family DNA-binding domain-containing protein [Candidatus Thermoplasmatota archaeon]